ncbi:MAG: NUDIX hydrolase, partial [Halopseudomonas sp.]
VDQSYGVGEESLEVRLFSEAEIPWDQLAFPTVGTTLKQYFSDRQEQHFPIHVRDIRYNPALARQLR